MDDSDRLSALRADLVKRLGPKRYDMWIGSHTSLVLGREKCEQEPHGLQLLVGCASTFELQWLRQRIHTLLLDSCRTICGPHVHVGYHVVQQHPSAETMMVQKTLIAENGEALPTSRGVQEQRQQRATGPSTKNAAPRGAVCYSTFANFVVGRGNELAHRTAMAVAERASQFGPLLLHGPAGTGKTHLLYAIAHHVKRNRSILRTLRLTAEQFTTEFLEALNQRGLAGFRQKYRSLDVLLVDDIQFLLTKRATFEELLITIDSLNERGKQIVLTCDICPQDLLKVSPELASRISGGLAIPIELPDFGTRKSLVRKFTSEMHPTISMVIDEEIVVAIATQVAGSARQLQGAINRLVVSSQALGKPLTVDLARTILAEYVQHITPLVRLADIQRALCEVFSLDASELKSTTKVRSVSEPRMLGMWLACHLTRSALGEISEFFGRRSHSTVISAQKKIERMVSRGETIAAGDRNLSVEEAIRRVQQVLRRA